MELEELKDVLRDLAMVRDRQVGLPASAKQIGVVAGLFRKFWEDEDGEIAFAQDADWFRHETLELVWGRRSLHELDMACVSVMIDELGSNFGGKWELSERGEDFMYSAWDALAKKHPTQDSFL